MRCCCCLVGGALLGLGLSGALFYAVMYFGTDHLAHFGDI